MENLSWVVNGLPTSKSQRSLPQKLFHYTVVEVRWQASASRHTDWCLLLWCCRLHQQLCESVEESQLVKEGCQEGERDGLRRSTTALQNQLLEISKVHLYVLPSAITNVWFSQERDEYRGKLRQMTFELEYLQKSDRVRSKHVLYIDYEHRFFKLHGCCRGRHRVWRSIKLSWLLLR